MCRVGRGREHGTGRQSTGETMRCAEARSDHRDASVRNGGLERVFGCGRADRAQSRTGNATRYSVHS